MYIASSLSVLLLLHWQYNYSEDGGAVSIARGYYV